MSQNFFGGESQTIKNAYFLPGADARGRKITRARSAAGGSGPYPSMAWIVHRLGLRSSRRPGPGRHHWPVGRHGDRRNGAVVQGAQVVALNPATGTKVQTNSNDAGYYELGIGASGAYVVSFPAGVRVYRDHHRGEVHAGDSVTLPVHLQVGATPRPLPCRVRWRW